MIQTRLFLPFTPNGKSTELRAIEVKRLLGTGVYASVDPYLALARVPARLVGSRTLKQLPELVRQNLCSDEVSAIGLGVLPATGEWLIYLNPTHAPTRQKVSLMEELVHIALRHPPTELTFDDSGSVRWKRPFNKAVEDEAFCVGAACIVPYRALFNAIKQEGLSIAELAMRFGVSEECAWYRVKRAGLTNVYKSLHRAA